MGSELQGGGEQGGAGRTKRRLRAPAPVRLSSAGGLDQADLAHKQKWRPPFLNTLTDIAQSEARRRLARGTTARGRATTERVAGAGQEPNRTPTQELSYRPQDDEAQGCIK